MTSLEGNSTLTALKNRCFMHLLESIARKFNEAGVALMVLKGAALHLVLEKTVAQRPMLDLDLLVKPDDIERARAVLEELGCLRGQELVREDFFPRFHYEVEYVARGVYPMKIDLHVRPFRPLRYSRFVPDDALWTRAQEVRIGRGTVLVPCHEDMLLHLAVHAAVHGFSCLKWLDDIRQWTAQFRSQINWDRFASTAEAWHLALPAGEALRRAAQTVDSDIPPAVLRKLSSARTGWRDRIALRQAPRDAAHPMMHVLVNALCTPGWRFTLAYLKAVFVPDRRHMEEWYCRRHRAWLPCAHLVRWLWPVLRHVRRVWTRFAMTELRPTPQRGTGLFATRDIAAGETIIHARRMSRSCGKLAPAETQTLPAIKGKLRYLNRSRRPNSELCASGLVARRRIPADTEITIICEEAGCGLGLGEFPVHCPVSSKAISEAA